MPPSVHKILIHGSLAIKYALVPIGQLSEEAQREEVTEQRLPIYDCENTIQENRRALTQIQIYLTFF